MLAAETLAPVCWAIVGGLACAGPPQRSTADSTVATTASVDIERGVLGYVHEGDTTLIEEYTRTARTLEGIVRPQVQGAKFGWARYRVELGPSGTAERAVLEIGRRSDESKPVRTWTATIGGGQVLETSSDGRTTRVAAAGSVVPFFPPSIAMFHEAVRQAHRSTGARGRTRRCRRSPRPRYRRRPGRRPGSRSSPPASPASTATASRYVRDLMSLKRRG
jgi:hypothetical protein